MDNIELITLCRQGKMDAFNEIYSRYAKKALRTAYLIVDNKNIAEDIVQEAFYECFRGMENLRNPEIFDAWFNKLLIRICWKLSAKERRCTYDSLDETYDENILKKVGKSLRIFIMNHMIFLTPHTINWEQDGIGYSLTDNGNGLSMEDMITIVSEITKRK